MANWLEDLTHMVSDDQLPRREALRRLLGVVAGATLAAWLPEQALARPVAIPHARRGTWSLTGFMSEARAVHTATLLTNGIVLVAGGYANDGPGYLASAELYDPTTGTWSPTGSMSNAREYYTATLLKKGTVLVAGGLGRNDYLSSAELYDPSTGTWSVTGAMIDCREAHTATLLKKSKVLAAGGNGCDSDAVASAELYHP